MRRKPLTYTNNPEVFLASSSTMFDRQPHLSRSLVSRTSETRRPQFSNFIVNHFGRDFRAEDSSLPLRRAAEATHTCTCPLWRLSPELCCRPPLGIPSPRRRARSGLPARPPGCSHHIPGPHPTLPTAPKQRRTFQPHLGSNDSGVASSLAAQLPARRKAVGVVGARAPTPAAMGGGSADCGAGRAKTKESGAPSACGRRGTAATKPAPRPPYRREERLRGRPSTAGGPERNHR